MDPRVISLDIETYGKWSRMPRQTCFTPFRSAFIDGVPTRDQVLTCAITIPTRDPRLLVAEDAELASEQASIESPSATSRDSSVPPVSPNSSTKPWSVGALASLKPGPTMVLRLRKEDPAGDYYKLLGWLNYADSLIGMNIQFDLLYLRASRPALREILVPFRHLLIDLSVVNFLEFEARPERSLKTLGPVLGAYTYRQEDLEVLSCMSDIMSYNAQDTHNTLVAVSILARRILRDFPSSAKLSAECLQFYSDTIWSCILMTEAGVPFNRSSLQRLHSSYLAFVERTERLLESRFGLVLSGFGSVTSKQAFLEAAMEEANRSDPSSPIQHDDRLVITPELGQLSFCDSNRSLIASRLPPSHPLASALRLINTYTLRQKILSTYLWPLLYGARKNPTNRSKILVPTRARVSNPEVQLSHATWFVVPSKFKDDQGSSGGTIQARLTCKDGAHQTDPPQVQKCRASRWHGGTLIRYDASQIELRVPAVLSGEPSMVSEYLKSKPDLHTAMTVAIFGESILSHPHFKKGTPEDPRQVGKTINFLILFRGGPDKLQATLLEMTGVLYDLALCRDLVEKAKASRPVLWAWQTSLIKEAESTGSIVLPITGQSRTFMGGEKYEINEIVNYPVQSHAANVVRDVMHRVARAIVKDPEILMFLNVYDALYFDCANDDAASRLRSHFASAVSDCQTVGYWNTLCSLTGHRIPLVFE